ncbi:MAG: cyanophycinase [Bacillota bacterium]
MATTLVLHGGVVCDSFYQTLRRVTDGERPRVAVILSASSSRTSVRASFFGTYCERFTHWGFEPVFVPLAIDNYHAIANDAHYVNLVDSCQAVFLGGGSQASHARSLLDDDGAYSPLAEAVRRVMDRGGVVAGNSAGTHVISNPMYSGGSSYEALRANGLEPKSITDVPLNESASSPHNSVSLPGLGLIDKDVLLCTHHDARGRLGRLIVGVRDLGTRYGVGIDEETTLVLRGRFGEVSGHCGVFIVEVIEDTRFSSARASSREGNPAVFSVSNLRLHYLTAGDKFTFTAGRVMPGPGKRPATQPPITPSVATPCPVAPSPVTPFPVTPFPVTPSLVTSSPEAQAFATDDVFSRKETKYRATRVVVSLVNSRSASVNTLAARPDNPDSAPMDTTTRQLAPGNLASCKLAPCSPQFQVTFSKDDKTAAYTSDAPYSESRSAAHLEGLTKTAVESMRVDVGVMPAD